jgi:hypothetical protein
MNIVINEYTYDLSHLSPTTITVDIPDQSGKKKKINLYLRYSTHCYSSKNDVDGTGYEIFDGRETRFFSLERYNISLYLPEIMKHLATPEKCYFASHRNYFIGRLENGREFRVFFSIKKANRRTLSVYVESAYFPDSPERKKGSIKGFLLLAKTLRNEPIKKPSYF